jgi:alpha-galactosidase
MQPKLIALEVLSLIALNHLAHALSPTPDEMAEARRWVAAKFEGAEDRGEGRPGLAVLANHGHVQKNARGAKPLNLAGEEHTRGLMCHAPSEIRVRLPAPGATFTAVTGVDSNEQTRGRRGSVVFSVHVAGREAFRSEVAREGMAGVPVKVDLAGAREFVLRIGDAGDGIGCDQADWAEARVELADGASLWLADLPLLGLHRGPFSQEPPFSFTYGGKPSAELLGTWKVERASRKLDDAGIEHTLTYTDPATGLVARCVGVEYHDFPTVEWTLYLRNTGAADTPVLADIQALDAVLRRDPDCEFVLHHHTGDNCSPDSYQPHQLRLEPRSEHGFAPAGGRPTNGAFPYYNVEWPGEGVIVVVGWPGQWAARFTRDGGDGLRVRAGQELTHFTLHPGEEVRSPLVVLQFWQGDRVRAQNLWRRWMLAHNAPRLGRSLALPAPMLSACSGGFMPGLKCDEATEFQFVDDYAKEGIKLDYWWMDAGWYPCGDAWPTVGTWEPDPERFPHGIKAVSDRAHAKGMKLILWFEPERVTPGTWLYQQHPEWQLGADGGTKLLNLGNADARQWLTDHVDSLLTSQGIDLYRQDFNMDPLSYWRANDAEDRQGMTEIRHAEGYLAYWDELRRRHPDMLIDSCASGGRRNDLETLRRAVPLLRSDYQSFGVDPGYAPGNQCHTYGLASWIPFFGSGVYHDNTQIAYTVRSYFCPSFGFCWDVRQPGVDLTGFRRWVGDWRAVADYLLGDFYPLTSYHQADDVWMAWQFDRPDLGGGAVQAFRRAGSPYESARFRLRGLDPEARYRVTDGDRDGAVETTGRELMETGLPVRVDEQPGAAIITYRKTGSGA